MFKLSTRQKMKLANVPRQVLMSVRGLVCDRPEKITASRGGISWNLDLNEGIDLSIYLFGGFETQTQKAIRKLIEREDFVLIDVGANMGSYSLPMAKFGNRQCKVYSVEPTRWAYSKLLNNLAANPELSPRVQAFQAGFLSEGTQAPESLGASWKLSDLAGNESSYGASFKSTEGAEFLSLDAFVVREGISRIDFLKIDVDGYEMSVLRSAESTIGKFRPPMMVEYCPDLILEFGMDPEKDFLQFFADHGYRLMNSQFQPLAFTDSRWKRKVPKNGGINLLATH